MTTFTLFVLIIVDGGFSKDRITKYDPNNSEIKTAVYTISHGRDENAAKAELKNFPIGSVRQVRSNFTLKFPFEFR